MVGGKTILSDSQAMLFGGIALVAVPAIVRVLLVQAQHILVAVSLCQYRCCCYVGILPISLNDALLGQPRVGYKSIAVDG